MAGQAETDEVAAFTGDPPSLTWDAVPEGYERDWKETFSSAECLVHVEDMGDQTPWYRGPVAPLTIQVVPPMLALSRGARTTELLGSRGRWIQAGHESELLAPVPAGVPLHYRGSIPERFTRNGRFWLVELLEVFDGATGTPLLRERRRFVVPAGPPAGNAGGSR